MGNIQLDSEQIAKSWEGRFSFRKETILHLDFVLHRLEHFTH